MTLPAYLDTLGRALEKPSAANLERARVAITKHEAQADALIQKVEARMMKGLDQAGLLPDQDALSTPAPLILEARGRTEAGSAVARLNAVKHGILSEVVPDHERETYAAHVAQVMQSYNPHGYLETRLCERIASSLWRLQRLERYESAIVSRDTAQSVKRLREAKTMTIWTAGTLETLNADEAQTKLESARAGLEVMRGGLEAAQALRGEPLINWIFAFRGFVNYQDSQYKRAERVLEKSLRALGCEDWQDGYHEAGDFLTFDLAHPMVTAAIRCQADARKAVSVIDNWQGYTDQLEAEVKRFESLLAPVNAAQPHTEALSSVPSQHTTDKLAKYEAHIERGLYRAMHELEALQDKRAGRAAPLARLEVHGIGE